MPTCTVGKHSTPKLEPSCAESDHKSKICTICFAERLYQATKDFGKIDCPQCGRLLDQEQIEKHVSPIVFKL